MSKLYYGFLDESGILEKKTREGGYFIVSVVIVADPAEIKNVMRIARRRVPGKFRAKGIFKARHAHHALIKAVLRELVKRKIEIIIGAWDKRKRKSRMNKNILYGKLLVQTVKLTLKIYPKLNLVLHKRYTNPKIINQINNELSRILKSGQALFVDHKTEIDRKELELADAVAWAVFQKYNRRKNEFYEIIKKKVKKESRLAT